MKKKKNMGSWGGNWIVKGSLNLAGLDNYCLLVLAF